MGDDILHVCYKCAARSDVQNTYVISRNIQYWPESLSFYGLVN